jgi:protein involved in polysaccharide export with SLBB domain
MLSRIRALRRLSGLTLALLTLAVAGQHLATGQEATDPVQVAPTTGFDPLSVDRSTGLMVEATPVFEVVDENAYIVGPGDILYVAMGTRGYKVMISPDGAAIIDGFPPVNVAGKSLAQARKQLLQTYQRYYKGGGVQIALAQAKTFQVSVTGAVNVPGMYALPPGSRLSNAIRAANGVSRSASQRVVIRNAAGEEKTVDLGGYYRDGELANNPYLSQGDHVFMSEIDFSKPAVYVQSEKGTRAVQIAPDDNIEAVVARSVDFENAADWDHLNVFQNGRLVKRVDRAAARDYMPPAGSTIEVRSTQMLVFVGGAVLAPAAYPYNPTFTILDYISRAGITYNTADARSSFVIDAKGDSRKVNANKESPRPGDHIIVPRSTEAKARDWVNLTASVSGLIISIVSLSILINQQ